MFINEELAMKKGMDCLSQNLGIVEIEMFISAVMKCAYDYTQWRQEYFKNTYTDGNGSQLENFLISAANNDPKGVSAGVSSREIAD